MRGSTRVKWPAEKVFHRPRARSQPTDMKTNVSSDHMKATLQNINHLLHHIYQLSILYQHWEFEREFERTYAVKQIIKIIPFTATSTHTNKPLSASSKTTWSTFSHYPSVPVLTVCQETMDGLWSSACMCVFASLRFWCMHVFMYECVCMPHKVKQPLNKFESMTHWGLPSPSISADRMACLSSVHAAHCGL